MSTSIAESLLGQFDHEMATTRRTLERVPDDKFDWKPHQKSTSMGALTSHLATIPGYTIAAITAPELDFMALPPEKANPQFTSRADALAAFDTLVAEARAVLANAKDEVFMEPWTLRAGDHVILNMPKIGVVRGLVLSHSIHHRAQLGVYLRLNDIPVPSVYGPSADENTFA